jgi:hypothetical protein
MLVSINKKNSHVRFQVLTVVKMSRLVLLGRYHMDLQVGTFSEMLVYTYGSIQCHNPEKTDKKPHILWLPYKELVF